MSKYSRPCIFFNIVLILVDADLASCFDFRTLAQRAAKKAKVPVVEVADDSPVAATGDVPEPSLPDPSAAPRSSPQRSPQRKSGFHTSARRARLKILSCANILMLCLVLIVLCRGGAASSGASGGRSRGAAGPAVPAKAEPPG